MLPLCFCAFLAFGAVLVLLGANQASLAAELGLDLARSGLLASALALGLGAGVVIAGPLFDRYPRRPMFVGSLLLAAAALIGVERDMTYPRWLVHAAAAGAGIGIYDTLINAIVVQRYRERAARPMLAVHSAATIGAMLSPPLVGWIAAAHHFTASFAAAGWAHVAIAVWAACVPLPAPEPRATPDGGAGRVLALAALLPLAAVAFAYVGVEASVTMFAVPYASGALGLDAVRGQRAIGAFWLGLLVGRLAVLGVRAPVLTLEGTAEVVVPPGTQSGQVLRLRGRGLPRLSGEGRGDLYVTVRVAVPRGIDARTQELFREIGRLLPAASREAGT